GNPIGDGERAGRAAEAHAALPPAREPVVARDGIGGADVETDAAVLLEQADPLAGAAVGVLPARRGGIESAARAPAQADDVVALDQVVVRAPRVLDVRRRAIARGDLDKDAADDEILQRF